MRFFYSGGNYNNSTYATGELPYQYCHDVIVSYLGLMKHCNNDALRRRVLEDFVLIRKQPEPYHGPM